MSHQRDALTISSRHVSLVRSFVLKWYGSKARFVSASVGFDLSESACHAAWCGPRRIGQRGGVAEADVAALIGEAFEYPGLRSEMPDAVVIQLHVEDIHGTVLRPRLAGSHAADEYAAGLATLDSFAFDSGCIVMIHDLPRTTTSATSSI